MFQVLDHSGSESVVVNLTISSAPCLGPADIFGPRHVMASFRDPATPPDIVRLDILKSQCFVVTFILL